MLFINEITDPQIQEYLCSLCGVTFDPDYDAYSCYEDGHFLAICQYRAENGQLMLKDLCCVPGKQDPEALIITGRGVLNFADQAGYHDAFAVEGKHDPTMLLACGFKKDADGCFRADLRRVFGSEKCHGSADIALSDIKEPETPTTGSV